MYPSGSLPIPTEEFAITMQDTNPACRQYTKIWTLNFPIVDGLIFAPHGFTCAYCNAEPYVINKEIQPIGPPPLEVDEENGTSSSDE